ncbi:MAG: hypothetical protein H7330_08105 [Hymenobacteraceae bacterium]|nr:hypothetical protein [Hymenobacteraceae bacterium]
MTNRFLGVMEVRELPTGEVLLAGYARAGGGGKFQPMIFKLTATGALVCAHRWESGTTGPPARPRPTPTPWAGINSSA